PGKQVAAERLVRVLACLAEGVGMRATTRVFEVDPNAVLRWLVEAAEQPTAFAASFLCALPVNQVQRPNGTSPPRHGAYKNLIQIFHLAYDFPRPVCHTPAVSTTGAVPKGARVCGCLQADVWVKRQDAVGRSLS